MQADLQYGTKVLAVSISLMISDGKFSMHEGFSKINLNRTTLIFLKSGKRVQTFFLYLKIFCSSWKNQFNETNQLNQYQTRQIHKKQLTILSVTSF